MNVAPFVMVPDKNLPAVTYFCMPTAATKVSTTTAIVAEIKSFLEAYLDEPFPHKSFHVIFDNFPDTCELATGAGIAAGICATLSHVPSLSRTGDGIRGNWRHRQLAEPRILRTDSAAAAAIS